MILQSLTDILMTDRNDASVQTYISVGILYFRSWQSIQFSKMPVTFVKIVGTHNTANEVSSPDIYKTDTSRHSSHHTIDTVHQTEWFKLYLFHSHSTCNQQAPQEIVPPNVNISYYLAEKSCVLYVLPDYFATHCMCLL